MCIPKTILFIAALLINSAASTENLTYEESKALLEENCSQCAGISTAELEQGVSAIEALMESGSSVPLKGRLLLARSYNVLAFQYESDTDKRRDFLEKKDREYMALGKEVLKRVENEGAVVEGEKQLFKKILMEYGSTLEDPEEKGKVLEKILSFSPDDSDVMFAYGDNLRARGNDEEGFSKMEEAFSLAKNDELYNQALFQGMKLLDFYSAEGQYGDVERVLSLLENKGLGVSKLRKVYLKRGENTRTDHELKNEQEKTPVPSEMESNGKKQPEESSSTKHESVTKLGSGAKENIRWYTLGVILFVLVITGLILKCRSD